ncbi:MAG: ATP-binding cassette domain-containing protein [Streptosporangiaceae bacterium]
MGPDPVIAAGIGVRLGRGFAVRAASFRLGAPEPTRSVLGIQIGHPAQATAIIDLLAGVARPAYGELRVLGHDMATVRGRAAVRRRVGVARRTVRSLPWLRVRGLVAHGARLARHGEADRQLLAAAILDELALTPWADVPLRAVPEAVGRRARLAAAAAHQPELLLLDGLLDGLELRDITALATAIRALSQDSGVVLAGCDGDALRLACDEVLVLTDGVVVPADR